MNICYQTYIYLCTFSPGGPNQLLDKLLQYIGHSDQSKRATHQRQRQCSN